MVNEVIIEKEEKERHTNLSEENLRRVITDVEAIKHDVKNMGISLREAREAIDTIREIAQSIRDKE